jgi:hypothetical protein
VVFGHPLGLADSGSRARSAKASGPGRSDRPIRHRNVPAGIDDARALFSPQSGDLLTTVIYYGGFFGNLMSGILYFLTVWLGYAQPDVAGHVHDYGTKFLVAAGLLNLLAMVDAFEIATGRKD